MEREIDLSARHLVGWLRAGQPGLSVRVTREYLWDGVPASSPEVDSEDDLEVATTVGLLEVRPLRGDDWVLRLRIDSPLACHLPQDGSVPEEPEEIDLDEFEACFLDEDSADGAVTVEADRNPDARAFDKVLAAILASRKIA